MRFLTSPSGRVLITVDGGPWTLTVDGRELGRGNASEVELLPALERAADLNDGEAGGELLELARAVGGAVTA